MGTAKDLLAAYAMLAAFPVCDFNAYSSALSGNGRSTTPFLVPQFL